MADETKEKWMNYLAMTTVILAVSATLSTFRGAGYSTRSVINEIKASNQWNYYQAKKIRGYLFEVQRDTLENDLKMKGPAVPKEVVAEMNKLVSKLSTKITKWDDDRMKIEKQAREFETIRDQSLQHSKAFGLAVVFLQMAILLSSIAALMKKKFVWVIGLAMGAVGLVYFLNGFLLFF